MESRSRVRIGNCKTTIAQATTWSLWSLAEFSEHLLTDGARTLTTNQLNEYRRILAVFVESSSAAPSLLCPQVGFSSSERVSSHQKVVVASVAVNTVWAHCKPRNYSQNQDKSRARQGVFQKLATTSQRVHRTIMQRGANYNQRLLTRT
jgi:hypothetical protein